MLIGKMTSTQTTFYETIIENCSYHTESCFVLNHIMNLL